MLEELLLAIKLRKSHCFNDANYELWLLFVIKISKQSGKKQDLAQNVIFFVFHQVRRREKEEGEKSSGVGIFA